MNEQSTSATALAKTMTEDFRSELKQSPNSKNSYHLSTWSSFEKRLATALQAASAAPVAAVAPAQDADAEKMRSAILAAKGKFNEFFKLANAGKPKDAGMCVMDAETLLTASLMSDPKPAVKTATKSRKPS